MDPDGIRVSESGRGRRSGRARIVVGVAAIAVVLVVALTAGAVMFLRRDSIRPVAPLATSGDAVAPPVGEQHAALPGAAEQHAAAPAFPSVVRAVPKVPPAHVATAPTPSRRMRRTDRVAANVVADRGIAADRPAVTERATDHAADASADTPAAQQRQRQMESLARDVIDGLRASGETGGLAAFPPHGTVATKIGLVVPDGYELPEGYIRYYQTTDDGERLPAILMFSPDYDFVDDSGNPVALPKDGVVPPEMAPPGLPQRTLEVPKTRTAGSSPRRPGS